jgi:Flp pilus assembly pilin Flp
MLSVFIAATLRLAEHLGTTLRLADHRGARRSREEGQTTAEYALVILAAAAIAVVLIAWARSSGKLPAFFDAVIDQVIGSAQ